MPKITLALSLKKLHIYAPFLQSKHLDAAERVAVLYVVIGGADPLAIRVPPLDADPETRS